MERSWLMRKKMAISRFTTLTIKSRLNWVVTASGWLLWHGFLSIWPKNAIGSSPLPKIVRSDCGILSTVHVNVLLVIIQNVWRRYYGVAGMRYSLVLRTKGSVVSMGMAISWDNIRSTVIGWTQCPYLLSMSSGGVLSSQERVFRVKASKNELCSSIRRQQSNMGKDWLLALMISLYSYSNCPTRHQWNRW